MVRRNTYLTCNYVIYNQLLYRDFMIIWFDLIIYK